jgi:hypothetical protein
MRLSKQNEQSRFKWRCQGLGGLGKPDDDEIWEGHGMKKVCGLASPPRTDTDGLQIP